MAQTSLECANAALIKLGNSTIGSLADTDKAATTVNARIDVVKKALLRSHPWNFAVNRASSTAVVLTVTAITNNAGNARLTVTGAADHSLSAGDYVYFTSTSAVSGISGPYVVTSDDSATQFTIGLAYTSISGFVASQTTCWKSLASEWVYLLPMPAGLLRVLSVTNGALVDVEYRIEAGGIATNESSVVVKYVKDVTDYALMDPLFYEVMSAHLAWDVCFQLTQSNELKHQLWQDLRSLLGHAKFVDATEDSLQTFESNDWITARSQNLGS